MSQGLFFHGGLLSLPGLCVCDGGSGGGRGGGGELPGRLYGLGRCLARSEQHQGGPAFGNS